MKAPTRKDPLTALEDQDTRQRRDALKATKFVIEQLSGNELRIFLEDLAKFLRQHQPKTTGSGIESGSARS